MSAPSGVRWGSPLFGYSASQVVRKHDLSGRDLHHVLRVAETLGIPAMEFTTGHFEALVVSTRPTEMQVSELDLDLPEDRLWRTIYNEIWLEL